jgi:putative ABC transport system substrate-binding protein
MIAIDFDPFARGYVTSLSHPTGNVTGIFFRQIELSAKRLEVAKELVPGLQSAAVFWDSNSSDQFQSLKNAGQNLGIRLFAVEMGHPPYDYEAAWERVPAEFRRMLLVPTSGTFFRDRQQIADFSVEHRIPAMFVFREWVDAGGLVSYGASIMGLFARAAEYVGKLAKGAQPSDLPIEQPTKFELILNLKTAKKIGLAIPEATLLRANEVILCRIAECPLMTQSGHFDAGPTSREIIHLRATAFPSRENDYVRTIFISYPAQHHHSRTRRVGSVALRAAGRRD